MSFLTKSHLIEHTGIYPSQSNVKRWTVSNGDRWLAMEAVRLIYHHSHSDTHMRAHARTCTYTLHRSIGKKALELTKAFPVSYSEISSTITTTISTQNTIPMSNARFSTARRCGGTILNYFSLALLALARSGNND